MRSQPLPLHRFPLCPRPRFTNLIWGFQRARLFAYGAGVDLPISGSVRWGNLLFFSDGIVSSVVLLLPLRSFGTGIPGQRTAMAASSSSLATKLARTTTCDSTVPADGAHSHCRGFGGGGMEDLVDSSATRATPSTISGMPSVPTAFHVHAGDDRDEEEGIILDAYKAPCTTVRSCSSWFHGLNMRLFHQLEWFGPGMIR